MTPDDLDASGNLFGIGARIDSLLVIIGRNTFSAAQNLINAIEMWTHAVFVGEPSSSRPNSVGEETSVRLPWSGLQLSISSRFFQDSAPTDHRPWIPVEIPVELSSADYFANRDPALEAILAVVRAAGQGDERPPGK